jgi:hypothetical protein
MVLFAIFLTPAQGAGEQPLRAEAPDRWRSLCARPYDWIEAVRSRSGPPAGVHA